MLPLILGPHRPWREKAAFVFWKFRKLKRHLLRHKWLFFPFLFISYIIEQIRLGMFPCVSLRLLRTESPLERRLYYALRSKYSDELKTQYTIGSYKVDLAIPKYKLALECDGTDLFVNPKSQSHHQKQQHDLRNRGWRVMRFSRRRLLKQMDQVVSEITEYTNKGATGKFPFTR
ncbi:endonuclease domain-containing protein [Thermoactinomyces mirandus]|uniref:DUF559 domain-containing protein n=1 Tax=Thermoactinomyces mirandus TaxID=2756294 RepID=A0A7W1XQN7_9BACL|nr:DUF559 domain-containing protein [Thermoactinomyces mirandus]MBA4601512.1 DUF559 domain-containing protein [Thermoactinomyces mirandus]